MASLFDKIKDIFKPNTQTTAQPTTQKTTTPARTTTNVANRPVGTQRVFTPASQPSTVARPTQTASPVKAQPKFGGASRTVFGKNETSTPLAPVTKIGSEGSLSQRAIKNGQSKGEDWSKASTAQKKYNETYYRTLDNPTHTKMYTDLEKANSKNFQELYKSGREKLDAELKDVGKQYGKNSNEYKALQQFSGDYEKLRNQYLANQSYDDASRASRQLDQTINTVFAGYMSDPDFMAKVEAGKKEILSNPQKYKAFTLGMKGASEEQKNLLYAVFYDEDEKGARDFYDRFLAPTVSQVSGAKDFAKGITDESKLNRFANIVGGAIGGMVAGDSTLNGGINRGIDAITGRSEPLDSDALVGDYTVGDAMDDYLKREFSGVNQNLLQTYGLPGFERLGSSGAASDWYNEAKEEATDYEKQLLGYIYVSSDGDEEVAKDFWRTLQGRAAEIRNTVNGGKFDTTSGDAVASKLYQDYLDRSKLAQGLYKAAVTTGSMGTQKALSLINPIMSGIALGFGVFGNAYAEARAEGKTRDKALGYAASEGFVEGLLETLMGKVSNISGFSLDGAIEKNFIQRIASPYLRAAIRLPINFAEEGTEEYLENGADVLLRNLWFSEKNKFEPLSQENLDTFFYAGLAATFLGAGGEIRQTMTDVKYAEVGKALRDQGSVDKLVDMIINNPIDGDKKDPSVKLYNEAKDLAEQLKSGKLKSNDINVGEAATTYDAAIAKAMAKFAQAGGDVSFLTDPDTVSYNKESLTVDNLIAGAKSMLVELGGDAKLAEDIVKASRGEQISQETWRAIQADTNAMQVLTQLQGELDMSKDTALSRAARASTRAGTGNQVYDTLKAENTDKTIATPAAQRLYEQNVGWDEAQQIGGLIDKVMTGEAITEDEAELISVGIPAVRSVIKEITGVELSESSTIGAVMTAMNDVAAQMAKTKEMQAAVKESTKQTARMPIPPAATGNSIGGIEISHDEFIQKYMARNEGVTLEEAEAAWNQRRMADAALSGEEENNGQQRTSHDQGRNDLGERRGGGENPSGTDQSGPAAQPGRRGSDAAGSAATGVRGLRVSDGAVTTDGENADTLQDQYPDIVDLTDRLKKSGFTKITYVTKGNILNSLGQRVPGVCIGTELILSLDYKANGYSYVATAIHEEVHLKLNLLRRLVGEDEVNRFVSAALQSLLTKEQYTDAFRAYVKRYGPAYATYDSETRAYMINEEIFADMVAGVSNFGTTLGEFSEDAAAYMEDSNLNTVVQNLVDGLENPGEITNIEYVEGLPHEIPVDTLISDKNVDSPSTAPVDPGDTSRFAFFGLAEALGFTVDIEGKEKVYYGSEADAKAKRNGFTQVTVEQVANSPIGQLIQYSVENGYITKEDAKHELELFAAIGSITDKTRDFYMSMQFMGSTIFTAMKANSDKQYGTTYDFPSICTKTQAVVDNMSAQMVELGRALTEDEIKDTYNKVFNDGNPVPCPECYVFTRWVGIGGLLDHIKHYQDTYAAMTPAEVVKEYYTQLDALMQYAEANGLTKGKAKGSLASKLDKDMADLTEAIQTKENQGKSVPKKDYDRLRALESKATTINALSWLEKVYFGGKTPSAQNVNKNFVVPNDVLFDLNNGEAFARDYPGTWAFRTSQGAGYGKAIAPYAEATLGEGILVTANTTNAIKSKAEAGRAGRRMDNPFLTEKGPIKPNSKRSKKLESAIKKQLNQLFIGGQRFQSTSDARFDNAVDYLLAALEMQAMGGGAQVYTKVLGAVPFFEATGMCTNMSMMPYGGGLDTNNQPVDSKVGGVDPEVAQEMRLKNEHAGTITIGVNDAHIRAMFNQVFRDFIIPYHASGGKMSLIEYFRQVQDPSLKGVRIKSSDYTKTQSDRILSDEILRQDLGKSEREVDNIHRFREMRLWILTGGKTGKMDLDILSTSTPGLTESQINARSVLQSLYASMQKGGKWHGVQLAKSKVEAQIFPNEFWDTNSTYETSDVNTQRYLDYCDALGFLHRFSGQTVARGKASDGTTRNVIKPVKGYDKNGEEIQLTDLAYKYDKDGNRTDEIEPFFWKTLTDRRMYGNDGQYLEQPRVTLTNLNDETVTTFASPMGERRYDRKQSLKTAQELVAKRRAEGTMPKARLSIQDSTSVNDLTEAQQRNRDFNDSQTEVGSPLKTLQGTTIKRYKGIAGKEVSPQVYVHKDYAEQVVPAEALSKAEAVLSQEYPDFNYNTIMYDRKSGSIRFDEAPDFDSAREPIAGNTVTVYPDGRTKAGYSDSIWHHKWLWVGNDYDGFDVEDSWNWSKQWLNTIRPVDPSEHKFNSSFSQRGIANGTGHGTTNWNEQLEYFGLPTDGGPDVRASVADDTAPVAQQYSSEDTSINNNKLPSVFTNKWFKRQLEPGGVNIDIGGGKYDNATEYLRKEYDVANMVFDPFNRDREHNSKVLDFITRGNKADTVTCANVLNVINEAAARENVILECAKAVKPDGKAFFLIYEGDKSGNSRATNTRVLDRNGNIVKDENGKTLYSTSWQEHREAITYLDEIKKYFEKADRHSNLIVAYNPKPDLPKAAWEVTPGEAVRFSIVDENHNDWAPEFYSKMERVIDDWTNGKGQPLGAKMAANQVVGWLKGKGVKSEEIKWSGIVPYLEGKKTVTKEELQQVMAENEVKIETKTLESGRGYTFWSDQEWDNVKVDSLEDLYEYGYYLAEQAGFDPENLRIYPSDIGYYIVRDDTGEILVDAKRSEAGDTRWSDYTLPGGENYREILFKMPAISNYTNRALDAHWGYGDNAGTIAHARVQDMRDTDDGKVLFVEEIQSDLHNAAAQVVDEETNKRRGFQKKFSRAELDAHIKKLTQLKENVDKAKDKYKLTLAETRRAYYYADALEPEIEEILIGFDVKGNPQDLDENTSSSTLADFASRGSILDWINGRNSHSDREPLGPLDSDYFFTLNHLDLFNMEHWDVFDELQKKAASAVMEAIGKSDRDNINACRELYKENDFAKEEMEKAEQIFHAYEESEGDIFGNKVGAPPDVPFAGSSDTYHEYVMKHLLRLAAEGDYDKIGWTTAQQQADRWSEDYLEGYRIEYDQTIPKFMDKYGKQWGAKVGSTVLDNGEKVWSVDITPEMKDSVLHEGQPRFSMAPDEETTENQNTSTNPYKEGTFEYTVYDMLGKINSPQELQDYINGLREKQQQDNETRNAEPGLFPKRKLPPVNEKEQQIRRAKLDELIEKYGAFKQGEKAARKYPIPERVSETRRVNRGVRTIVEAKAIPDRLAERLGGEVLVNELLTYEPITDSDALSRERSELARLGYEKALKEWESKSGTDRFPTKYDIAFGGLLLRQAANNGDDAIALRIAADLAAMERQAGQVSQAGRLLKQLGPVGQLYYIKKAVDRLNHQNEGRIAKGSMQPIVIDPDLAEAVVTAKEQKDIDDAMDELIQSIADQLPVTMKDRWDAWRYLSMLGNPRTHIRNIAGNAIFTPVRFAKDLLAAAGESVFIKDESQRTKDARALMRDPRYNDIREFAKADYKEMEPYLTGTGKMNPLNEIMNKRKVLPGVLDKISRKNDDWLTGEDAFFLKKAYVNALTQFIAARGVSLEDLSADVEGAKILNEARKYAALEAQKATYRDFSQAAAKLNALKRGNSFASWLLDGVMPFTKTPINILKRGVEYSPIGLAKALTVDLNRVKNGDITAAEAIDHAAAGLTGTGVAVLGWLLASLGMARGGPDDDDKKDALEKAQGHQDYSLEIDGKSYTIDWMAPVALPFFVGVEAQKLTSGDGPTSFYDFVNAMMLISEPMTSLSMLEGINSTLSAVRQGEPSEAIMTVLTNAAANYLSQGVPTFAGQIARTADPYRRSTYVDKNSETPAWMQRFLQNVQGKVPGLADNKMAYVDTWGRKDTNESMFLRGLENFISPGYANRIAETPVDMELLRLYDATGDNDMLPGTVAKYFQVEGETLNLTADQYEEFKTVTGKTAFELIGGLLGDVAYNGLDDQNKAKVIQQALKIATAVGKQKVAPTYQTDGWIQRAIDHDNTETSAIYHTLEGLDTGLSNYQLISAMDWLTDDERGKLIVAEHPNTNRNMTDYTRKKYKFVLTDDQIKREREIYESLFWPEYTALLSNPKYTNGDITTRAELIKDMQSDVSTEARKALGNELRAAGYTSVILDDSDVPDQVANLYDLLNRG